MIDDETLDWHRGRLLLTGPAEGMPPCIRRVVPESRILLGCDPVHELGCRRGRQPS